MHNLKTVKIHTVKAHLDRLQDTAENLAAWSAGEVLAGRLQGAQDLALYTARLLAVKASIEALVNQTKGPEPAEN